MNHIEEARREAVARLIKTAELAESVLAKLCPGHSESGHIAELRRELKTAAADCRLLNI